MNATAELDSAVREALALVVLDRVRAARLRAYGREAEAAHGAEIADELAAAATIVRIMRPIAARAALHALGRDDLARGLA